MTALAWSPTGTLLASGSADTSVRTWTFDASGALRDSRVLRSHTGAVDALSWCPVDVHILATAASDRSLILWDTRTGKQASSVVIKGGALNMAWTADGAMLAVGDREDCLRFIDTRKAAVVASWQSPQELNEFAFTPSGLLVAGTGLRGAVLDEGNLTVLHVASAAAEAAAASEAGAATASAPVPAMRVNEVTRVRGHGAPITLVKPAPGWARLATGGGDGMVCFWDTAEMVCTGALDRADGQIRSLAWGPGGSHLAVSAGDSNDNVKTLDVVRPDGTLIRRIGGPISINHVAWHPTAAMIAYALDDVDAAAAAGMSASAKAQHYGIKLLAAPH